MSIYVETLSEVFTECGIVKRVDLPTDRNTGRGITFVFVQMSTQAEQQQAMKALSRVE